MPTVADLQTLAKFLLQHKWPLRAKTATWGADQVNAMSTQITIVQNQVNKQADTIGQLQQQVASLQAQVASLTAQANPAAIVVAGAHLHTFAALADATAFLAVNTDNNPIKVDVMDITWHPTT